MALKTIDFPTAFRKKYATYIAIPFVILLLILLPQIGRWDLTSDQRYTLSSQTEEMLQKVSADTQVQILLGGDIPSSYRELSNETLFLLHQFQNQNSKISYSLTDPISEGMSEDSLMQWGARPFILPEVQEGKVSETTIYPYALISSKGRKMAAPLMHPGASSKPGEEMNHAIQGLEYQLLSGILDMQRSEKKKIGIIINHDELNPNEFVSFMSMASRRYQPIPVIPENDSVLSTEDLPKLKSLSAIVMAKPRKKIAESEKIILDQYIMHGGRSLWMIDAANVEMDSLTRSGKITAFPQPTGLEDLFFSYGFRLRNALVKDLKKHPEIKVVTGEIGGNPQFISVPWPYFPLGIAEEPHPITRNINPVKMEFATSIELLPRQGVKSEILFTTSEKTVQKALPAFVNLEEAADVENLAMRENPTEPKITAVALEGNFPSSYALRQERNHFPGFKSQSAKNRMVIVADGDVGRNKIIRGEPAPMGVDILTEGIFGNEQFLQNALDWLLDDEGMLAIRNKFVENRPLDPDLIYLEGDKYKNLNLWLPSVLYGLLGIGMFLWRKKKYSGR